MTRKKILGQLDDDSLTLSQAYSIHTRGSELCMVHGPGPTGKDRNVETLSDGPHIRTDRLDQKGVGVEPGKEDLLSVEISLYISFRKRMKCLIDHTGIEAIRLQAARKIEEAQGGP